MYCRERPRTFSVSRLAASLGLLVILMLAHTAVRAADNQQIKIEEFSLNRSVAYLGEEISADITVSAKSSLRKKTLRLRYYLDKKEIGRQTIKDFDSSGNARTVFTFKDSPEGRYNFRVVLDIENEKIKADEVTRQVAVLSLPTGMTESPSAEEKEGGQTEEAAAEKKASAKTAASDKPELAAEEISFNIASPRVGEKVTISTKISNTGGVQADNVKVRTFINGQLYGKDITMNIAAGTTVNVDTEFKATRQGKKDVLVFINPDGEIDEKSNRNNLLSKILIVRPAARSKKPARAVVSANAKAKQKPLANLVIYIETISGTHYTDDGRVKFYITNNSRSVATGQFKMGVQELQHRQGKLWLLQKQVKRLKPGETVTLVVKWPEDQLSSTSLYVATVDIDGKIDETDIRDNHTRPFRVLSTAATQNATAPAMQSVPVNAQQEPEITITSPPENSRLQDNGKLVANWQSRGEVGARVRITVSNSKTNNTVLSSTSNNDGAFTADLSALPEGKYVLAISSEDRTVTSQKREFQIARKKSRVIPKFISPPGHSSYRGEQQMRIAWPAGTMQATAKQLNLVLLETSSKNVIKLNNNPVDISKGEFFWQVPDNGSVFGIYQLQAISTDGKVLAVASELEILPNFVSYEQLPVKENKEKILSDLEIARTSFRGKNLEFLIMNNGPADISASGLYGYKFTSYFVRKVPITSDEDLVICHSTLLSELPQGEGQVISLGRDPDCPLGERDFGSKFKYVVNRFTLPRLDSQYLVDPKPLNNLSKFYWPDK